jgi:peptide/nickel transport system substrate-binding protein
MLRFVGSVAGVACVALGLGAITPAFAANDALRIGMGFLSFRKGDPYQGITLPSVMAHQAVYDTLTSIGEKGEVLPSLAVSWKAENPSTWVFTLRQGVTYSNGEPFDVDALVVSAAYMATPKGRSETIGSTLYQVDRVEKIDDLTARVHLNEPDALFPLHAAAWRLPAPKAFTNLGTDGFKDNPIGTGPFVVTSWDAGHVKFRANPTSWRKPKISALEMREIPEETARLQALVSGSIDLVMGLSQEHDESLRAVGATLVRRVTPTVSFLAVNTEMFPNSPLKDPRVRIALNYGVNRQAIIDGVMDGVTDTTGQLTFPGAFGYDPTITPYPYDPDKARELLAAAGFKDGLKFQVGVSVGTRASDVLYYQQIAADLQKIGVDLELISRPQQTQMQDLFFGKLKMDMFTMFTRGFDALADYRHRTCGGLTQGRAAFHCDPAVLPALKAALAENDAAKREALYRQVAKLEKENPPGIMLWQGMEFDGVARGVTGYAPVFEDTRLHLIEKKAK